MSLKYYYTLISGTVKNEGWLVFFRKSFNLLSKRLRKPRPVVKLRGKGLKNPGILRHPPENLPKVDIIIVTYNSQDDIPRCLKSIHAQEYPAEKVSVFIVDSNSSDNTIEAVKDIQGGMRNLTLIESKENRGFGAANNLGFKSTSGSYILFLNPDTELKRDTLLRLVYAALETVEEGFCAWEARQQAFEQPKLYDPVTLETEWVTGACFLVSRKAFEEIGGFDENIFLYAEDVDLSWRLRGGGYKLQYVPGAVVMHYTYDDEGSLKPTAFFNSLISNGILRYKFGGIKDIIAYHLLFTIFLLRPPRFKNVRSKMLKMFFSMGPNIIKALAFRFGRKKEVFRYIAGFNELGYGVYRIGELYKNKPLVNRPLVTIIIRTTQRPYYLREALQSLRNQTYSPLEVIVVEDGKAASEGVIKEFGDLNIKYIPTGAHLGRCRAGNHGLTNATGKYINFLDDDDLLFADHIEVLAGELENDGMGRMAAYSIGLLVPTDIISTDPFQYREMDYRAVFNKSFDREALHRDNYIPLNCMLFSRELFLKESGFDETLDLLEDWDLWRRYSAYTDFIFVEKATCMYRVPGSRKIAKEREKLRYKARQTVIAKALQGVPKNLSLKVQ